MEFDYVAELPTRDNLTLEEKDDYKENVHPSPRDYYLFYYDINIRIRHKVGNNIFRLYNSVQQSFDDYVSSIKQLAPEMILHYFENDLSCKGAGTQEVTKFKSSTHTVWNNSVNLNRRLSDTKPKPLSNL